VVGALQSRAGLGLAVCAHALGEAKNEVKSEVKSEVKATAKRLLSKNDACYFLDVDTGKTIFSAQNTPTISA